MKKKSNKDEIRLDIHDKFFTKDGKFYVQKSTDNSDDRDIDELVFVQVDKKKYDKRVQELADKLYEETELDARQVIAQALRYLSLKDLRQFERNLIKKKPVTVEKGCVELKCGNAVLPIC